MAVTARLVWGYTVGMSTILQTNIFFYITSFAVVVVTMLIVVGLFYILSILRNIKDISNTAKRGTDILAEDITLLHERVKKRGFKIRHVVDFFLQLIPLRRKRSTKTKK